MLSNHPLRVPLADELHTRPFPKIKAPTSAAYLLVPLVKKLGFEKYQLTAALILPVILLVWLMICQIKRRASKDKP